LIHVTLHNKKEGIVEKKTFNITSTTDGVFMTKNAEDGGGSTRVADPIEIRSIGKRLSDQTTFVEIRFKTIRGDYLTEMLARKIHQRENFAATVA
jgi:hypothetical protein